MTVDLDLARKRILAGESLTLEEHKQIYDAWRAQRESRAKPKASKEKPATVKGASLDELFSDFGVAKEGGDALS